MNRTKLALVAGAAATIAATTAAIAVPASATATISRAAARPATTTPVSDYWEQTHSQVHLTTAGTEIPIMSRRLPAGSWVLHADQTMVNFDPSDFGGCSIADTFNNNLNTHRTIVGNPNVAGAKGPAPWATVLSETAAISVSVPTTVTILCEHDTNNGASPYIDPNADLWAHRATKLVIAELP
ncbi:MAG TPA: hypothetical protein VGI66_13480 [Streptosporangiaceae bacterium]